VLDSVDAEMRCGRVRSSPERLNQQFTSTPLADRQFTLGRLADHDDIGGMVVENETERYSLDRFLADAGVGALVASREGLLCAVVDVRDALRHQTIIHEAKGSNLAAHYTVAIGDIEGVRR
jgi:hypothetical protein